MEYYLGRGYELRFIEQTPLDAQHAWLRNCLIAREESDLRLLLRSGVAKGELADRFQASIAGKRAVLTPLAPVAVRVDAGASPPPWYDCDTPEELFRASAWTKESR